MFVFLFEHFLDILRYSPQCLHFWQVFLVTLILISLSHHEAKYLTKRSRPIYGLLIYIYILVFCEKVLFTCDKFNRILGIFGKIFAVFP